MNCLSKHLTFFTNKHIFYLKKPFEFYAMRLKNNSLNMHRASKHVIYTLNTLDLQTLKSYSSEQYQSKINIFFS